MRSTVSLLAVFVLLGCESVWSDDPLPAKDTFKNTIGMSLKLA